MVRRARVPVRGCAGYLALYGGLRVRRGRGRGTARNDGTAWPRAVRGRELPWVLPGFSAESLGELVTSAEGLRRGVGAARGVCRGGTAARRRSRDLQLPCQNVMHGRQGLRKVMNWPSAPSARCAECDGAPRPCSSCVCTQTRRSGNPSHADAIRMWVGSSEDTKTGAWAGCRAPVCSSGSAGAVQRITRRAPGAAPSPSGPGSGKRGKKRRNGRTAWCRCARKG